MFEWLFDEMGRIKTNKFHRVDGPPSADERELVERSALSVPPSYKHFVVHFGGAKLYRWGSGIYRVQVFAVPVEVEVEGEALLHFGRTDRSLSYFKRALLVDGGETPVFEWYHGVGLRKTADGFEEWLAKKCEAVRRRIPKKEWRAIEAGPAPFDDEELAIVEARRKFRWRRAGTSATGDVRFEVFNDSSRRLPFLSVGIRGMRRDGGTLEGGVWLPVSHVAPGQTATVEHDCYKEQVDPERVEAYPKPDPGPEDRELYWEFRRLTR